MRPELFAVLMFTSALLGCAPEHYSVGIARGPDHVTYAQRHDDSHNDYLVDCPLDASGNPINCKIVELLAE